jgi:hypothetical protein
MTLARPIAQPLAKALARGLAQRGAGGTASYLRRLFASAPALRDDGTSVRDSSATGTYRPRQPGRCLDLDGSTQYVDCGNDPAFSGLSAISAFCWFNATETTNERLINKGVGAIGNREYGLLVSSGNLQAVVADESEGDVETITGDTTIETGRWYFAGFTFGDGKLNLWLDGEKDATEIDSPVVMEPLLNNLRLGSAAAFYHSGKLSDARIYNRVLTDDEIKALYWQGLQTSHIVPGQPDATNLAGKWLLDDNSVDIAYDSSGNGNHGTIVNGDAGMLYEGDDVPANQQNLVGYSRVTRLAASSDGNWVDDSCWYTNQQTSGDISVTFQIRQSVSGSANYAFGFYDTGFPSGAGGNFDDLYLGIIAGDDGLRVRDKSGFLYEHPSTVTVGAVIRMERRGGFERVFLNGDELFSRAADSRNLGIGSAHNWPHGIGSDFLWVYDSALDLFDATTGSLVTALNSLVPANASDPTSDVLGNPLDYSGPAPVDGQLENGPCLTFNGTNQHVSIPTLQTSGSFSWSVYYYRPSDAGTSGRIISAKDGTTQLRNYINSEIRFDVGGVSNDVLISDDTWYHIVAVYDATASTSTVYINGVEANSETTVSALDVGLTGWDIGRRVNVTALYAKMSGFGFRHYDYALTPEQVNDLPDDPIFWLPFSEGDGDTVYDVIGGNSYTIGNYAADMWTENTQDQFFYNVEKGCRVSGGVATPALADGSAAADGNPITGTANTLNNADCNLNLMPEPNDPIVRSYLPGATFDGVGDSVESVTSGGLAVDISVEFVCYVPNSGSVQAFFALGTATCLRINSAGLVDVLLGGFTDGVSALRNRDVGIVLDGWNEIRFDWDALTSTAILVVNGVMYEDTVTAPEATDFNTRFGRRGGTDYFSGVLQSWSATIGDVVFEYDFRRNYGTHIPDLSGNGNHGTWNVNSSLAEIFAPELPPTDYTQGDGLSRPHYLDVDAAGNETNFRTEIE